MRATSQNRLGAELIGINTARIHSLVFALGTVLAMTAGFILIPLALCHPYGGWNHTLKAFVVTVLGAWVISPGPLAVGLS
ncbi:MAG: hypothetical protein R2880_19125 [Deinococcales bacterium]